MVASVFSVPKKKYAAKAFLDHYKGRKINRIKFVLSQFCYFLTADPTQHLYFVFETLPSFEFNFPFRIPIVRVIPNCLRVWYCIIMSLKQRRLKFEPRI